MNKLTSEEIAKVFGMYLDNKVQPKGIYNDGGTTAHDVLILVTYSDNDRSIFERYKLSLTTLSNITDEHAIEVGKMAGFKAYPKDNGNAFMKQWQTGQEMVFNFNPNRVVNIYNYLISKGYAVPLWFGIDHWANGKTAIELEIAIDQNRTR